MVYASEIGNVLFTHPTASLYGQATGSVTPSLDKEQSLFPPRDGQGNEHASEREIACRVET